MFTLQFKRFPPGETRLKLVDLFDRDDEQNKLDFIRKQEKTAKFADPFLGSLASQNIG